MSTTNCFQCCIYTTRQNLVAGGGLERTQAELMRLTFTLNPRVNLLQLFISIMKHTNLPYVAMLISQNIKLN